MENKVLFFRFQQYNIWWHYTKLNKLVFALFYWYIIGIHAAPLGLIVGALTECIIKKDYKVPKPASEYITFARIISLAVNKQLTPIQKIKLEEKVLEYYPKVPVNNFWFNFYDQKNIVSLNKYLISQWTSYLAYSNFKIESSLQTILNYDRTGVDQSNFIQYWNTQLDLKLTAKGESSLEPIKQERLIDKDLNRLGFFGETPKDIQELKSAYIRVLKEIHPDTSKTNRKEVADEIKELKLAFERLKQYL